MDLGELTAFKSQYFILTAAGKPVFTLNGTEDDWMEYGGIVQAIVSYMDTESEVLRSFKAKNTLFVAKIEYPLTLLAIDKLGQSETQLRTHLDILHAQVLSTLTQSQLAKAFDKNPRLDLKSQLGGTEVFLRALTKDMVAGSPGIWLGALESLLVRKAVRQQIHHALLETRVPSLLYGLILADKRLVGVARPRKHSLHPPDLYLIISMLFNTTAFLEGEHWVPICLPKFNPKGFLYVYISFVASNTAVVLISPDRLGFFEMQGMGRRLIQTLINDKALDPVISSAHIDRVTTAEIGVPLIHHFVFKSRGNVQFIQSSYSPHFQNDADREALMLSYRQMQAYLEESQLRICHKKEKSKTLFGWVTSSFELYCITGAISKDALSRSVREIINWIRSKEERLFILDGATF